MPSPAWLWFVLFFLRTVSDQKLEPRKEANDYRRWKDLAIQVICKLITPRADSYSNTQRHAMHGHPRFMEFFNMMS